MTLPNYKKFHIGYSTGDLMKNAQAKRVYDSRGDITNEYVLVPNFTSGNIFDGFITIYAENDKALHDILQEIFDTPVMVGSVAPNLDANPEGD